jgi:hypothetical protein
MATKSGGRPGVWAIEAGRIRTPLGHNLVLLVTDGLKAHGQGALRRVLAELRTKPPYNGWELEQLRQGYYTASKASPPATDPRDQWLSDLQRWGRPPEASRALVDRLIAIVTHRLPYLGLAYVGQMFDHVTRVRRLSTGQRKIEWLERAAAKLESDRPSYPIRPWDQGSNANIELIKAALGRGLTSIGDIAARTGIKPRTVQDLLVFLNSNGDVVRYQHGHYIAPQEGVAAYVPPGEAILRILESKPATPAKLRARTGLNKAQVAGALHWLWKRAGKIVRLRPGLYALPGTAPVPHIYARDAIMIALRSGKKSVPELITVTGKNRGEIWAALRRLCANGMVEQVGFRSGHAVRRGFRGRVAMVALTAKGRRRERRGGQPHLHDSLHI